MPPVNDNFADATVLSGATGSVTGDNTGATWESAEPAQVFGFGTNTVWFTWTAPADGDVRFALTGTAFDTILEIYTGSSLTSLTLVDVDDDSGGGGTSALTVTATSGTTYWLRVFGYNDSSYGVIHLAWGPPAPPPPPPPAFVEVWAWLETASG